jgi:hypothetical protein
MASVDRTATHEYTTLVSETFEVNVGADIPVTNFFANTHTLIVVDVWVPMRVHANLVPSSSPCVSTAVRLGTATNISI